MVNIPLTIKLGKRKERSQMCELMTTDGRWTDIELPVSGCLDYEKPRLSFLIDSQNQYLAEDNQWHQLLTENSVIPICLRKRSVYQDGENDEKELSELGDQLYEQRYNQAKAEQFEIAKQSESWNKFLWLVSIVCGTMLIVAAMNFIGG